MMSKQVSLASSIMGEKIALESPSVRGCLGKLYWSICYTNTRQLSIVFTGDIKTQGYLIDSYLKMTFLKTPFYPINILFTTLTAQEHCSVTVRPFPSYGHCRDPWHYASQLKGSAKLTRQIASTRVALVCASSLQRTRLRIRCSMVWGQFSKIAFD